MNIIIDIPAYIQVEGILEGKRKPNIYQVLKKIPVQIKNVEQKEDVIAYTFKKDYFNGLGSNGEYSEIITPYIECNSDLYEPLCFKNFMNVSEKYSNDISSFIKEMENVGINDILNWNLKIKKGTTLEEYNNSDYNEDTRNTIGNDNLEIFTESDFKQIIQTNYNFIKNKVQKMADNILLINNHFFMRSYGPCVSVFNEEIYSGDEEFYNVLTPFYNKDINFRIQNYPYSLTQNCYHKNDSLQNILNKPLEKEIMIPNMNCIILNPEKLHELTEKNFGFILYEKMMSSIKNNILSLFKDKDKNYKLWLTYMKKIYPFSEEIINSIQKCKDENYSLDSVIETYELFNQYGSHFQFRTSGSFLKTLITTPLTQEQKRILKYASISDNHIFNGVISILKNINGYNLKPHDITQYQNNETPTIIRDDFKLCYDFQSKNHSPQPLF